MATLTKPSGPQDDQRRIFKPAQDTYDEKQAVDREFAGMTSPDQYKKSAVEPDYGITPGIREHEMNPEEADPKPKPGEEADAEDISAQEKQGGEPYEGRHRAPDSGGLPSPQNSLYKKKPRPKGMSGLLQRRKGLVLGVAGFSGFLLFIGGAAFILFLLAPYKEVHFAEVLRSIAFARANRQLNQQYSRVIFDAATLTDDATGEFPRESLVRRLALIRPDRQIKQLGREGHLKWDFAGDYTWGGRLRDNVYRGVEVGGKYYGLNETSRDLFSKTFEDLSDINDILEMHNRAQAKYGLDYDDLNSAQRVIIDSQSKDILGKDFNELSRRETMRVRAEHNRQVRGAMADVLKPMGRSRYKPAVKAFNRITDVGFFGWRNKARDFYGLSPEEARRKNIELSIERARQDNVIKTGIDDIDEDAEERRRQAVNDAINGSPTDYTGRHRRPDNYEGRHRRTPGQIRNQLAARLKIVSNASDAVFAVTLACIIHTLSNSFEEHERAREKSAAVWGNQVLSKADQTKAGRDNVEAPAINAESSMWYGAENAYMYAAAFNRPTNSAMEAEALSIPWLSVQKKFSGTVQLIDQILTAGIVDGIPGLAGAKEKVIIEGCNVALSEPAQIITTGVELAIGAATVGTSKGALTALRHAVETGVGVFTGIAVADWVGQQIDNVIDTASNLDFTGAHTGTQRFNESMIASDYIANTTSRTVNFGRPLDQAEADQAQLIAMNDLKEHYAGKSFAARYLDVSNPFSLAGQVVARAPVSAGNAADDVRQGLASVGSVLSAPARLLGSVATIFTGNNLARAAPNPWPDGGGTFGVDEWGWSPSEQARIDQDESFLPANLARDLEPRLEELNDRYWKCYDVEEYTLQLDKPKNGCSRADLSTDDALKWRYYMSYLYVTGTLTGGV